MIAAAGALQIAIALVVLAHGLWWTLLSLVATPRPSRRAAPSDLRLSVIVPAHDEELLIGRTVASLRAAPYHPRPEILVVADNCSDRTAEVASAAGATVLVRSDDARRGKDFALDYALSSLRALPIPPGAVIVVDADSEVSGEFFAALGHRLASGARVVQAHYQAGKPATSLGRLRRMAFSLVHWSRPLGAARLGLGVGLKGNGMAFRWDVARDGLSGKGITEDAAATLVLAGRGIRVDFEPGAVVTGYMAQDFSQARTQDGRWESGRAALVGRSLVACGRAAAKGHLGCAAASLEVASLPLSLLLGCSTLAIGIGALGAGSLALSIAAATSLVTYLAAGLLAARTPPRDLLAFFEAPRFFAHKLTVYVSILTGRSPGAWHRTGRADPTAGR